MGFHVKVLADSISPAGVRLTTMEWSFPRCILAEVNTHRMKSSNAASSRAIPTEKLIQRVEEDPFIPEFRQNQKGMQAGDPLAEADAETACRLWLVARDVAVAQARQLHQMAIHKQYVNRLLEPWMWCTIIISATDWNNIWHLRISPEAEPSFCTIAALAYEAMQASVPRELVIGEWHLPLVEHRDINEVRSREGWLATAAWERLCKISVGRCARVSYLTHDGVRDPQADVDLHDRLSVSGHWSPFEHIARPLGRCDDEFQESGYSGNFRGWKQYRKEFSGENITEFDPHRLDALL